MRVIDYLCDYLRLYERSSLHVEMSYLPNLVHTQVKYIDLQAPRNLPAIIPMVIPGFLRSTSSFTTVVVR